MVGGVDTAAGVDVVPPGAPQFFALFYDLVVNAEVRQYLAHGNTADTCADDDNREHTVALLLTEAGYVISQGPETHLFRHHGGVLLRHGLTLAEAHHLLQQRIVRVGNCGGLLRVSEQLYCGCDYLFARRCRGGDCIPDDLIDALQEYLNDRFGLSLGALTPGEAEETLRARGASGSTAARMAETVRALQHAVYTGRGEEPFPKREQFLRLVALIEGEVK